MKNRMSDVRDHLVMMLEALGDDEADGQVVERAKATSAVANSYIAAVKVEMDAMRLADEIGILPTSVDAQTLPGRRRLEAVK
jgi:hypothetical protein